MAVNSWELPGVGKVDQRVVLGVGAGTAALVGFMYWRSRGDAGSAADGASADDTSDFASDGTVPGVLGAVSPTNSYGLADSDGDTTSGTDAYGFNGTTNSQWSQYASQQLSQSDTWSYTDIVSALGNYLSGTPLTALQKQIVQAAIAIGGAAPTGNHVIVSGGNVPITIAPSTLTTSNVTSTGATITFSQVAGAAGYRAYRSTGTNIGSSVGNSITLSNLEPSKSYSIQVAAITPSGATGPKSKSVVFTTKDVNLRTPRKPRVSEVTKTTAHVTTLPVKSADGYNWYVNGVAHGHSDGPSYTVSRLRRKTTYKVSVAADTSNGAPGKPSAAKLFKTK
jgi:hypothetical protein